MRDSLSLALSDALVVAPLMHVVHLHAQRSTNPSGTFFYHYQGQILASVIQTQLTSSHDTQDVDLSEYHVSSVTIDFQTMFSFDGIFYGGMYKLRSRHDEDVVVDWSKYIGTAGRWMKRPSIRGLHGGSNKWENS